MIFYPLNTRCDYTPNPQERGSSATIICHTTADSIGSARLCSRWTFSPYTCRTPLLNLAGCNGYDWGVQRIARFSRRAISGHTFRLQLKTCGRFWATSSGVRRLRSVRPSATVGSAPLCSSSVATSRDVQQPVDNRKHERRPHVAHIRRLWGPIIGPSALFGPFF